jgi:hypothetical protein
MFAFTAIVFLVYDWFVATRQKNTESKASKSNAIVQELFPGNVAMRLFEGAGDGGNRQPGLHGSVSPSDAGTKTIAELHPAATVLCTSFEVKMLDY